MGSPHLMPELSALPTLDNQPNNLPAQVTSLIGREREVEAVRSLLVRDDVRLVTLTGPAGTGKTRVGLQIALELADRFEDGAFFVELAPIVVPALVPSTIARALGVRDVGGRPVLESLREYLSSRSLLLVLDNFEQVISAAATVADLLGASPGLKVLVTSREPLRRRGEHEQAVPPLAVPERGRPPSLATLSQYPAVALFIERATAIRADFALTDDNAPAVAQICARLDGLPLAIELAAARVRLLSPQALLARLDRRLALLSDGARDLPARQQTLRGALAWSYDLLDEAEQRLFRRLAIFVGGCTLEAAEAVCDPDGELGLDSLDGVASLVSKSLLPRDEGLEGAPRFAMLETIREYGLEQLEATGEGDATRGRHAAFFLALAEKAEPELLGPDQLTWLRRLDPEHDNLRVVLGWSRDGDIPESVGLRLAGALVSYWRFRGHIGEARGWVEAMLALPGGAARTIIKARALLGAALLTDWQGDYAATRSSAEEAAAIFREADDPRAAGRSLILQGLGERGVGRAAAGRSLLEAGASIAREVGDGSGLAHALTNLGAAAHADGDLVAARALLEEAVSVARATGDRHRLGLALAGLGLVDRLQGSHAESAARCKETLVVSSELEDAMVLPRSLAGMASVATLEGAHRRAARLFAKAQALREASGTRDTPLRRAIVERDVADLRAGLGEAAFATAWAEGRAMSLERAIEEALAAPEPNPSQPKGPRPEGREGLTPREHEVAILIARTHQPPDRGPTGRLRADRRRPRPQPPRQARIHRSLPGRRPDRRAWARLTVADSGN